MEKSHLNRLKLKYAEVLRGKMVVALHIADEYEYMQAELIEDLRAKAEPILRGLGLPES